ncbi:hypothetical protein ACFL0D_06005 [Thermoproteota archaeon]
MRSKSDLLLNVGVAFSAIIMIQCIYGIINGANIHYSINTDITYGEQISQNQHYNAVINITNQGNYPSYGYVVVKLYNTTLVDESYNIISKKYHDELYLRYNLTKKGEYKDKSILFEINEGCTYSMVSVSCFNDWSHDVKTDYFVSFTDFFGDIPVTIMYKEKDGFYRRLSKDQMRVRLNLLKDKIFS